MYDETAKIIFHDFNNHLDFDFFFFFFFLYQPTLKIFSNNFKITFIFQCLITHFYLIHIRILSTLYLTFDSVCNDTLSYINIHVRRRIGIIFESLIRAPFWCDAGWHFTVARRNWNIQHQTC